MKQKLLFTLACLFVSISFYAQQKKLTGIAAFDLVNSGALMDKKNNVDGYYFFFQADKLKNKKREYAIRMLDNSLNEIATKSYIGDKGLSVLTTKFNNQALMYSLVNEKEKYFKLLAFDKQGNVQIDRNIPVEKKEIKERYSRDILMPIDDKGFLFNFRKNNKRSGYTLEYQATDGNKSWSYSTPKDVKMNFEATPMAANKNYIAVMEYAYKSNFSKDSDVHLLLFDIHTGKLQFKKEFTKEEDPRFLSNVYLDDENNVVVLGEYFEAKDNFVRDESLGIYTQVYNVNGELISNSKNDWEKDIKPIMPSEIGTNDKNRGHIFFNDFVKTKTGEYFAIGERFRKIANAWGIIGGTSYTQLVITDAIMIHFNSDFSIKDIQAFEKGKSRVDSMIDFGSPQYNAHFMSYKGAFDYKYTQFDERRNKFYSIFYDFERIKGEQNKYAYKAIIYNDGEITEDKIYMKNDYDTQTYVMPGKIGHVLLLEYDRKQKSVLARLAKLNL
ncbi:DUF6770 family protein [Mesonia ostreae]|uniref:DUF6770 family protein n=1 Tax=Mesonia ostreae TaxID=861110 RepID=A0ABU2KFB1_9FLAO|nr:DUF6770 family protein [Mesonia ostreae]MDT0293388.1 DUF6770 family protein [Mesonia ostreae]